MPHKLDREVSDPLSDSFGHTDFAKALKDLIEGPIDPPYSIGLLGKWGTGKSSIKALYCNDLNSDTQRDPKGKLRKEKIKEITFNAWKYGGNDDIKRALLRHLFLAFEGDKEIFQDLIYNTIIGKFTSELSHEKYRKKLFGHLINSSLVALFSATMIIGFFFLFNLLFPLNLPITIIATAFFLLLVYYFQKHYLNIQSAFEKYIENIRIEHPNSEIERWESLLFTQIERFHKSYPKYEKIVVFIDDLDRLSPSEMVDGLDGIRTFMEIPSEKKNSSLGIIFVISCDESRVAEAIKSRNENSDLPGAVRSEDDARRYLDRIFQFRLEIPPFPKYDMREFALAQLKDMSLEMIDEIEGTGVTQRSLVSKLIPPFVNNPRNVIQLVNAFSQSWWMAKKRELKGTGTDRCGGLLEGTITKYPDTLAIICVLKVNFPHFYDNLIRQPTLIQEYSQVFITLSMEFNALDDYTKFLLKDYRKSNDLEKDTRFLASKTLLHEYIQSIQGHKWPEASLHPFLALSQDAISRKYKTISANVFNSLIQGNYEGLIKNLGIPQTDDIIPYEPAELLNKLMDDIQEEEPEDNLNNARYVIASIIHRVPEKLRPISIEYVNSALISSREFRSRIGIDKIKQLIDIAHPEDQKKIVAALIDDAFGYETFEVKSKVQQSPTLDEAESLAKKIIELSLSVWNSHDLPEKSKTLLTTWLYTRKIVLKSGSINLNITVLENFMDRFENLLAPTMGFAYTDLIINEFENGGETHLKIDQVLTRCKNILISKSQNGGEDQIILWTQLSRLIAVTNEDAVLLARELAEEFRRSAQNSQITPFIEKLSDRLVRDSKNDDIDKWKECVTSLISFIKIPNITISPELTDKLVSLCDFYIKGEGSVNFGIDILEFLYPLSKDKTKQIFHNAITQIHEDLPELAVQWLAINYLKIVEVQEDTVLYEELNKFTGEIPTSEERLNPYKIFMQSLSEKDFTHPTIQNHIDQLTSQINTQVSQFDKHGCYLLPILIPKLKYPLTAKSTQNIQAFFDNAMKNPKTIADVHGFFIGHWSPVVKLSYQAIFNNSIQIAVNNPNAGKMGNVLASCQELLERNIVPHEESTIAPLSSAALKLWPNYPTEAMQVITSSNKAPNPDIISNLVDTINLDDENKYLLLGQIWSHFSTLQNPSERVQSAKNLLVKGKVKRSDDDDAALYLWFRSLPDINLVSNDIQTLLIEGDLQDEQCLRLWNVALLLKDKIDRNIISEFLTKILIKANFDKTANSILEHKSTIVEIFHTAEDRNILSEKLIDSYVLCENIDRKRKIVQIIREIQGSSKIKKLRDKIQLINADDIEILTDAFPSEKKIIDNLIDEIEKREDALKSEKPTG